MHAVSSRSMQCLPSGARGVLVRTRTVDVVVVRQQYSCRYSSGHAESRAVLVLRAVQGGWWRGRLIYYSVIASERGHSEASPQEERERDTYRERGGRKGEGEGLEEGQRRAG